MNPDRHPPLHAVREVVARALAEDLTPLGDVTSALLPRDLTATGAFVARRAGVIAGVHCVAETYRQLDSDVCIRWMVDDGDQVSPGEELGSIEGPLHTLLTGERTALNLLNHLSGVATLTASFVEAAAAGDPAARVWDTRKTTPGLRSLEKAAVRAGGGSNHRGNLSEWVMLKDNHLVGVGITDAVETARRAWPGRTVQIECDRLEQVEEALGAGADAILLDNMSPEDVREAVALRDEGDSGCLLEASGGITLETIASYAAAGVDMISVGVITNSAPVLDIGLDIRPIED